MSRALIKYANGRIREVKNLGWLLRNWQRIDRLEWVSLNEVTREVLGLHHMTDGMFYAYMSDGSTYGTPYTSFEVWKGFINRPVLRDLPVTVNGITGKV
jgi:hypothetical protein